MLFNTRIVFYPNFLDLSYNMNNMQRLIVQSNMHVANINRLSQMSYLLVVMLELNSVSEVQYKKIMIIGNK